MHSCSLSHKYEQLLMTTFSKSVILRVKNTFEPNVLKLVMGPITLLGVTHAPLDNYFIFRIFLISY